MTASMPPRQASTRVTTALMGYVTVECGMIARLMNGRIQAEITDQLVGTGEAVDVADRREHTGRDDSVHAADGHQPPNIWIIERSLRELAIYNRQLACQALEFVMVAQSRTYLVSGKGE
jgi:hypothetical protein